MDSRFLRESVKFVPHIFDRRCKITTLNFFHQPAHNQPAPMKMGVRRSPLPKGYGDAGNFPAENMLQKWSVIFTRKYSLFSFTIFLNPSINIDQLAAILLPKCFLFTKINNLKGETKLLIIYWESTEAIW
jgi:hypothetical protein